MGEQELIFDVAELAVVAWVCGDCQTTVLVDCANEKIRLPDSCPSCGKTKQGVQQILGHYRKFFDGIKNIAPERFQFRARVKR